MLQEDFLKKAIVTGITGQDGAYLAKLLLDKGYEVYGTYRRTSSVNFWRIEETDVRNNPNFHLVEYDLTDASGSIRLMADIRPDEVYNLAAQSFVAVSFEQPITTANITGLGALHLLEAIRIVDPKIKFYQASTSELYGKVQETPQTEKTPFYPRSPYGVAKLFAHWSMINYRESYNIFACSGILFNHESPLRGEEFVTRKITRAAARIKMGLQSDISLGNLDAKRDWGFAGDYVEAMWLMLQQSEPDDYVIATGSTHSVREFVEKAFICLDMPITWKGSGQDEQGVDAKTGQVLIKLNPKYLRPSEVDLLIGDPSKAITKLGWKPKTDLNSLVRMMVEADIRMANREKRAHG